MTEFIDSSGVRFTAYLVAAAVAAGLALHNRRTGGPGGERRFWVMCAVLLVALALGRVTEVGENVVGLGRDRAQVRGWYTDRRSVQIALTGLLGLAWLAAVLLVARRLHDRFRLAVTIALSMLVAFAAVRAVSLHRIDTVLYRRDISGVRIVSVVELGLLAVVVVLLLITGRRMGTEGSRREQPAGPP